jgi:hypothetical protein
VVGLELEDEVVGVAGKGREARARIIHVALGIGGRTQQRVQLIVLHVDDEREARRVGQLGDGARGLPGLAGDADGVHLVALRDHTMPNPTSARDPESILVRSDRPPTRAALTPRAGRTELTTRALVSCMKKTHLRPSPSQRAVRLFRTSSWWTSPWPCGLVSSVKGSPSESARRASESSSAGT